MSSPTVLLPAFLFALALLATPTIAALRPAELFKRPPGNPGVDGVGPYPPFFVCPYMTFEPRNPKVARRYGPYTYDVAYSPRAVDLLNTNEGCGFTHPVEDSGYIKREALPQRENPKFEISQIRQASEMNEMIERDVWVCWKAPEDNRVIITATSPTTRVIVYSGCACGPERAWLIGCAGGKPINEPGAHYAKRLVWDVLENHDYLVRAAVVSSEEDTQKVGFDVQPVN